MHSDSLWKHRDSHTSLLSNWCNVCPVPYFQTGTLSHVCHVTELFKCEPPLHCVDVRCAPLLHQHYIAKSNPALLPPIERRTQKFQRKAMPRIRRVTSIAPASHPHTLHTTSHTTSFCHPVQSDLLWKHRDSHTSLLSNCPFVPRLPRSLLSNWHIVPRLQRNWPIQVWATTWLSSQAEKLKAVSPL